MPRHLTNRIVSALPAPASGNSVTFDDIVTGFGCRVTAAGARAFVLKYRRRSDGLRRLITIGSYPDWSVAAAREEAKTLKRDIDGGGDPVGSRRAEREAPTVNDLADRYEAEQLPKRRTSTQGDYRSMLRRHIRPGLGTRKVATLAFADVDALHRAVTKVSGPYRANRVIALLSSLCAFAVKWHWRTDNPVRGIERHVEAKRKRYLTGAELERLSGALAKHDDPDAADIFRFLLLTGARRGETLAARWADIDIETGIWSKPAATTKQRTEHRVPLSAPARQLLAARAKRAEPGAEFVFPGRNGNGHRVEVKANWRRVTKAARISNLRIHDLRHSFASISASHGVSLHAIGELLGHTQPSTTHRYAHLFDDHLRQAIERVGEVVTGKSGGKVVPLK
jgi:integrase